MQDCILIEGLTVEAKVGILPWEKQVPQTLLFDLELYLPLKSAGEQEDLSLSVDYAAVASEIQALVSRQHHDLIETIAERICRHLLQQFSQIESIQLTLRKPAAVRTANSVGLRITRHRPS